MARQQPYTLIYAVAVTQHLQAIDAKHHSLILAKMEE